MAIASRVILRPSVLSFARTWTISPFLILAAVATSLAWVRRGRAEILIAEAVIAAFIAAALLVAVAASRLRISDGTLSYIGVGGYRVVGVDEIARVYLWRPVSTRGLTFMVIVDHEARCRLSFLTSFWGDVNLTQIMAVLPSASVPGTIRTVSAAMARAEVPRGLPRLVSHPVMSSMAWLVVLLTIMVASLVVAGSAMR